MLLHFGDAFSDAPNSDLMLKYYGDASLKGIQAWISKKDIYIWVIGAI